MNLLSAFVLPRIVCNLTKAVTTSCTGHLCPFQTADHTDTWRVALCPVLKGPWQVEVPGRSWQPRTPQGSSLPPSPALGSGWGLQARLRAQARSPCRISGSWPGALGAEC